MTRTEFHDETGIPVYSIVIPVYASAPMLPELHERLVSVMNGTGVGFEIIYVEDAGPDNSWGVLSQIAASDSRVTAVQLMMNSGQKPVFCL